MSKQIDLISPDRPGRIGRWHDDRVNRDNRDNRNDRAVRLVASGSDQHPNAVQIDEKLERLSWLMDSQFRVPVLGWRFGLNTIIDLIPGFGDVATTMVALYLMVAAVRYRVPKFTILRMSINIGIYFLGGLVPWLGALFDSWWKPNRRNIELLRRYATISQQKARKSDLIFVGVLAATLILLLFGAIGLTIWMFYAISHRLVLPAQL